MPKQEKSFVKKLFQTKKARLLYFIYRRRKIKNDSGVKAKLKRAFNYRWSSLPRLRSTKKFRANRRKKWLSYN
jgi:hypothetical protein